MSARLPAMPLWMRLSAIVLVAAVLPVLGAGLWSADHLERDARQAALVRLQSTARVGAGIVGRFVARGRDKIAVLARMVGERMATANKTATAAADTELADQLDAQVQPADLYLALQYLQAADPQRSLINRNAMDVQMAQRAVDSPSQLAFNNDFRTAAFREPLRTGEPFVSAVGERHLGFVTVAVSAPVVGHGHDDGVLLAWLDLRRLVTELRPLGSDLRFSVVDAAGVELVADGDEPVGAVEQYDEAVEGTGWRFQVMIGRGEVLAAAAVARSRAWTWTLVTAALALVLAVLAAAWIRRPIATLTRAAQRMAAGDLGTRVTLRRRDEIGALGEAFDRMAAALQQLDSAKSDFVATVSHELRTPLTSMRLSLANLQDGVLGELAPAQQAAIERLGGDVARLERIVRDTLMLARLESGAERLAPRDCDLAVAVAAAHEPLAAAMAARGQRLQVDGAGRCRGDDALLRVVLGNLLDNAGKFSPDGGVIAVGIAPGRVVVRDQGPGFATDRPFEPFVQGATAGVKNPGVGLGLAIAARIVRLHGGRITASTEGGGVVTVELPEAT